MQARTREAESTHADRGSYRDTQSISNKTLKRIAWIAGLMLIAFLVGFVPMWLAANGYERERDSLQNQAHIHAMRHTLASAALNADRGRFDEARAQASSFFTDLRTEFDREESALDPQAKEHVQEMLARRDEVITMLARDDRAAADVLADWYFQFENIGARD